LSAGQKQQNKMTIGSKMKSLHYLLFSFCVVIVGREPVFSQTSHYHHKANTGNSAAILIPASIKPMICGNFICEGDEIGVFSPAGLCVGSGVWTGSSITITIWGDDDKTTEVDGIRQGEQMQFRVWRRSTKTEYHAQNAYLLGTNLYAANSLYIIRSLTIPPQVFVKVKVFLQGAYKDDNMTTTLNKMDCIPLNSSRAYSESIYGYSAKSVHFIPRPTVVDWILLELRTSPSASTKVETQVAFLLKNGSIVDIDGSSDVAFYDAVAGNYYIVIRHRNHLAVMTRGAISLSITSPLYNFTTAQTQAYGEAPMKDLNGSGVFAMYGGDVNRNGVVRCNGIDNDRTALYSTIGGSIVFGYLDEDVNMNGVARNSGWQNDRTAIYEFIGGSVVSTKVPD
jgi:hypothetical protein